MQINGMNIFMGAYAERIKNGLDQRTISISKEKTEEATAYVEKALNSSVFQNQGVKVSISKEGMDLLCSEEGFQKMKQDGADLFIKNEIQKKVNAKDKNPDDPFWENTTNQWLVFSEMLYNNGFYTGMTDEEVDQFEDTLAHITYGMDCLSRSQPQYIMGMDVRPIREKYKFFQSESEAITGLESSVAALRYLSDRLLPEEYREGFNQLIDRYYQHNNEVISEYDNPMEAISRVIAGMHSDKNFYFRRSSEYKYTLRLSMIEKSEQEKKAYRQGLQILFEKLKNNGNDTSIWEQIKEYFQNYSTDNSDHDGFRNYVYDEAQYLFSHMKNCWSRLFALGINGTT
ncbi:MAG: hypothetical protein K2H37_08935 [Lachnospiraceae bacterium]|nr:hypothetical protein [Lachnospiraceae bacterium]